MKRAIQSYICHVLFLCSPQHVDPEEAVQIHVDIKSKKSIGMHWGTFILTDEPVMEPPVRVAADLKKRGLPEDEFIAIKHGEILAVEAASASASSSSKSSKKSKKKEKSAVKEIEDGDVASSASVTTDTATASSSTSKKSKSKSKSKQTPEQDEE